MTDKPRLPSSSANPSGNTAGSTKGTGPPSGSTPKNKPNPHLDASLECLAPPQAPDEIGRLANYRILKVLGRGGMGTVFLAEDPRLNRQIALKVMLPSLAKKKVACDRFKREAQATARLEHDNIVTIYYVDEANGLPYLAMPVLKGMTLDDWLKAGKTLNIPQVMRIGKEIAKGLAAAHAFQLIHRDIKPSNIWLDATNKGRVKILDFGLARSINEDTQLTQEGTILGTPAYMSPEQARGANVNEQSDLFSLGCVLYRLCAGRLPFAGKDPMAMLLAIISDEPKPVRELNPGVPASLAQVIHQLLAKKQEDRPASARDVVAAIQNIEREWIGMAQTLPTSIAARATDRAPLAEAQADPALEESAITELELQPDQASNAAPVRPARSWIFAALGGAMVAISALMCCMCLAVGTDQGTVNVVAKDDEAKNAFTEVGVTLVNPLRKTKLVLKESPKTLQSGSYDVEIPPGLRIEPKSFTIHRGTTQQLILRSIDRPVIQRITPANAAKLQAEWAEYLTRELVEVNSIGIELTVLPAGEFSMGSSAEAIKLHARELKVLDFPTMPSEYLKKHLASEAPAHTVRITKPFAIGMHEVTVGQFAQYVAATRQLTEPERNKQGGTSRVGNSRDTVQKPEYTWKNPGVNQTNDHPVCNVTWKDAESFCDWLSQVEKKRYRLPTEAEWEYACRAGMTAHWGFGSDISIVRDYMWVYQFKQLSTGIGARPVGKGKANGFGLFDMHGNVEEMCGDYWSSGYYAESAIDNPTGPAKDAKRGKVTRGGSFLDPPLACRSAFRGMRDPTLGAIQVGFRVVCELDGR